MEAAMPCWKELQYLRTSPKEDVIKFLDIGDKMYVSIKGSVEVLIAIP